MVFRASCECWLKADTDADTDSDGDVLTAVLAA